MDLGTIVILVWAILIIPAAAFFKVLHDKLYIYYEDGEIWFYGFIWPLAISLAVVGQLLYVLIEWTIKAYDWLYKFFKKHI